MAESVLPTRVTERVKTGGAVTKNFFYQLTDDSGVVGGDLPGGAGERVDGVSEETNIVPGTVFTGQIGGDVTVSAGAAVAAGVEVMTDVNGQAVTKTGTNFTAGVTRNSAAALGDLLNVRTLLQASGAAA